MIKKLLLSLLVILIGISVSMAQQATFKGTVRNVLSGDKVEHATVFLKQEGKVVNMAYTDDKGEYQLFGVSPGTYDIQVDGPPFICGNTITKEKVSIKSGDVSRIDIDINCANGLDPLVIVWEPPVFEQGKTQSSVRISGDDLRKTSGRSISGALANMEGISSQDGTIKSVRGKRSDGQKTIIDGVTVIGGSNVPMATVGEAEMIQGGIPAEFGDGTSFMVINTRGVAEKFNGSFELRGSLEGYNNFLASAFLTGPILKGKNANDPARIGFMIAAEVGYDQEPRPLHGGSWVVKDDALKRISETPLRYPDPNAPDVHRFAAEYLTADDFVKTRVRKNAADWNYLVQAKLDFLPTKDGKLKLTVGGTYEFSKSKRWTTYNSLLNSANHGNETNNTLRLNARINHRVYTSDGSNDIFKNLMYDIGVGYSVYNYTREDANHKDNFFNYGYIGKFKTEKRKMYERVDEYIVRDSLDNPIAVYYGYNVFRTVYDSVMTFTPGTANPLLTNYTTNFINGFSPEDVFMYNGLRYNSEAYRTYGALLNGDQLSRDIYSLYSVPGTIDYDGVTYQKQQQQSIEAKASLSLNLADHEIKLGFNFEKRTTRNFSINAVPLWQLMRNLQNRHMTQLDEANPIVRNDTLDFNQFINENSQSVFDRNMRIAKGLDPYGYDGQWLDIDNYDPTEFNLGLFSPEELLLGTSAGASQMLSLYGYDYTGKKIRGKTDITKFFEGVDQNGRNTYELGAYEPIYMSMYIQDKFSIQNLMFNIGLRVDRFDANQQSLKDPFILRDAYKVKELKAQLIKDGKDFADFSGLTGNQYDEWYVYINQRDMDYGIQGSNFESSNIIAYRNGMQWYNANGQEIVDPVTVLRTTGGPLLKTAPVAGAITKVSADAFEDFIPQWTWQPRLSFSFPVSDQSHFTAHYNIITRRATDLRISPVEYLFVEKLGSNSNNVLSNPGLKPQRSVEYEIGFSQRVGERSAVNITAYYSEIKDEVQVYRYSGAYPSTYYSYANIDFGTIQGFSFSYNLTKFKNISLRASYTIQFAKGTGSDASSQKEIVASGQPNLRTLVNLSHDQRHRISATFDYRFDGGAAYSGPTTSKATKDGKKKEIKWLENVGINILFSAGSGMPYTRSSTPFSAYLASGTRRVSGSFNGSHRPWTFQCDLRLDKTFTFKTKNKKDKEGNEISNSGRDTYMILYLDIQNIFNIKNILSVYDFTGNPDDDGYLSAAQYQQEIQNQTDVAAFRNYYQMMVNNPLNFGRPATVSLGIQFGF
ncbi:MAG: carboxypeptidase regulatory-like domain-containing protein [Bacteroidales bacterium]|jgi:hypothetical protein|nr:carboxypeptidase regulatory-like domain-containing protein [Bacteroidales bacterium]